MFNSFLIQDDDEWCELLLKFIAKQVIVTRKLNAHHCKEQLEMFFLRTYLVV